MCNFAVKQNEPNSQFSNSTLFSQRAAPIGVEKPRKLGIFYYSCVSRLFDELCSQLFEIIIMTDGFTLN